MNEHLVFTNSETGEALDTGVKEAREIDDVDYWARISKLQCGWIVATVVKKDSGNRTEDTGLYIAYDGDEDKAFSRAHKQVFG